MVACLNCKESRRASRANAGVTCLPGILVCCAAAVLGALSAVGQELPPHDSSESSGHDRVVRLHDSLSAADDWDIGIPVLEPDSRSNSPNSSFAASIRAGRALDTDYYLALDRDLRQVRRKLQLRPDDEATQLRLVEIRRALVQRIEINIEFDYLYAVRVYIALLELAGAEPDQVAAYRQQLAKMKQS